MSKSYICQSQMFSSKYIRDSNIFLIFVMCIFPLRFAALSFMYSRGHQVQSWRTGVPTEFRSNPNQTHLKQLIKVLLGILETSRQVC